MKTLLNKIFRKKSPSRPVLTQAEFNEHLRETAQFLMWNRTTQNLSANEVEFIRSGAHGIPVGTKSVRDAAQQIVDALLSDRGCIRYAEWYFYREAIRNGRTPNIRIRFLV